MQKRNYLEYIVKNIHSTIVATVDDAGLPVTCAIDMMDYGEQSLFFLTAKGKSFYDRLTARGYMALTAMKGKDTMSTVAVSVRGRVRELGPDMLPVLFEKNPYMKDIYPTEQSRAALTVFELYSGTGEWFDMGNNVIERAEFSFGGAAQNAEGYVINDSCTGCASCVAVCPRNCIELRAGRAAIRQENCIHCGNCLNACPAQAVERKK